MFSLIVLPFILLRQCLSLNPELHDVASLASFASQFAPGIPLPAFQVLGRQVTWFVMWFLGRDLSSCLHDKHFALSLTSPYFFLMRKNVSTEQMNILTKYIATKG